MRLLSLMLCLSMLFNCCCNSASAGALVMERTPYGSPTAIHAEGAAPNIGHLHDHNLVLTINEHVVTVDLLDPTTKTRQSIVGGQLFAPHLISEDGMTRFNAYCYFNSGEKLAELLAEEANTGELVVAKDGRRLAGRITLIDHQHITVTMEGVEQRIAVRQISTVVSPRVFRLTSIVFASPSTPDTHDRSHFHAKLARFELEPTLEEMMTIVGKKRLESRVAKASLGKWQKVLFVGGAILLTAAAIAIPVALAAPLAGRNRSTNNSDDNDNNRNQREDQQGDQDQDTPIR